MGNASTSLDLSSSESQHARPPVKARSMDISPQRSTGDLQEPTLGRRSRAGSNPDLNLLELKVPNEGRRGRSPSPSPSPSTLLLTPNRRPSFTGGRRKSQLTSFDDPDTTCNVKNKRSQFSKSQGSVYDEGSSEGNQDSGSASPRVERRRLITLSQQMGLSVYQEQQLVSNWPKIYNVGAQKLGMSIFDELYTRQPSAKVMLQKVQVCEGFSGNRCDIFRDHCKLLVEIFNLAIKSMNSPYEGVCDICHDYGQKHFVLKHTSGFSEQMWDSLSDVMLERVRRNDAVRKSRELGKAWALIIAFLVDKMKEGSNSAKPRLDSLPQL